jgi:release factor glutamine methyltransferase
MSIYEPREDSILLEKYVKKYSKGYVLDVGTGSGIQAKAAASSKKVKDVIATDIQEAVIMYDKENIRNRKIKFFVSDLFGIFEKSKGLKKKFDTIIFNPPYLPEDVQVSDLTLEGGKKGYEVLERFINEVNNYLAPDGIALIVFSSLTNKAKVNEFIKNNLLEHEELEKQNIFFEELYVYLIKKYSLLKKLEKIGIKGIRYFNKGKRGLLFAGNYKNKKIAVKTNNPESKAIERIKNEANFLKILNKNSIGPKLLFSNDEYLIYEFVEGNFIIDYLKNNNKENIEKILKKLFLQLFAMDKLKITKEEMSHPPKHIIIDKKNNPVLIDFERAHYTLKPCNVTQFSNFIISSNISGILKSKNIIIDSKKIIELARIYKNKINKNNLDKILENID